MQNASEANRTRRIQRLLIEIILQDANMVWDFFSLRPESTHQMMILFSDRGIPDGYRFMNGYGSHTFKLINNEGKQVYCKLHVKVISKC